MLLRGTTPYHSFTIPMKVENIVKLYITYFQNGEVILEKKSDNPEDGVVITNFEDMYDNAEIDPLTLSEEELNTSIATVHLTQEDTLKFHFYPAAKKNIMLIQLRLLDIDDEAYASEPIRERVYGVFNEEELVE